MATAKQIHWMGEAVQSLLLLGFVYLVIRMTDGASPHPHIAMTPALRVLAVLLLIAIAASVKTWWHYRKLSRRASKVS